MSMSWIAASFVIFMGCEVVLGGWMGPLLSGFVSRPFVLRVEVLLMLSSYFCGGLIVGAVSPSVRVLEPALGAAGAVLLTFV